MSNERDERGPDGLLTDWARAMAIISRSTYDCYDSDLEDIERALWAERARAERAEQTLSECRVRLRGLTRYALIDAVLTGDRPWQVMAPATDGGWLDYDEMMEEMNDE